MEGQRFHRAVPLGHETTCGSSPGLRILSSQAEPTLHPHQCLSLPLWLLSEPGMAGKAWDGGCATRLAATERPDTKKDAGMDSKRVTVWCCLQAASGTAQGPKGF